MPDHTHRLLSHCQTSHRRTALHPLKQRPQQTGRSSTAVESLNEQSNETANSKEKGTEKTKDNLNKYNTAKKKHNKKNNPTNKRKRRHAVEKTVSKENPFLRSSPGPPFARPALVVVSVLLPVFCRVQFAFERTRRERETVNETWEYETRQLKRN